MKSLAITTILTVGILSAVAYAGEIPEGKYVFSSPALFGSAEGEAKNYASWKLRKTGISSSF
jgi:hypothetical protein